MARRRIRARGLWLLGMLVASWPGGDAHGQERTPATVAAEALLEVVRSGDEARLRELIETRFAANLRGAVPMEEHLRMFGLLRRDLESRNISGMESRSPEDVSVFLAGSEDRLELRLRVEAVPPHRIAGLSVGAAGPELGARSFEELGPALERLAGADEFSGVVLAGSAGEVRFRGAYGFADREAGVANRPDTRFDIGSLGKLFTSAAILRLHQDGRLALDDAVGQYVDEFESRVAERVTLRHLLRHRSGFGDYLTHPEFEAEPKRYRSPADFLPLARAQALAFDPGAGRRYSNMGYVLLGAVIERVTGRAYHEAIEELVYGPAAMVSAGPGPDAGSARRYHRMDGRFVPFDSIYPDVGSPAGGSFAAAADLHRFFEALLDHRLLDAERTALMLNDFEPPAAGAELPEALGFAGGAAGVSAIVLVRPAERRTVVVLANIEPVASDALARRVMTLAR